jgi:hypothetical protein
MKTDAPPRARVQVRIAEPAASLIAVLIIVIGFAAGVLTVVGAQ